MWASFCNRVVVKMMDKSTPVRFGTEHLLQYDEVPKDNDKDMDTNKAL
jgi:hypothetical protein